MSYSVTLFSESDTISYIGSVLSLSIGQKGSVKNSQNRKTKKTKKSPANPAQITEGMLVSLLFMVASFL